MRATEQKNQVSVKAYAGTTGVLLAMNVAEDRLDDLLGFAIHREGGNRPAQWLNGLITFPGVDHEPGQPLSTEQAPIQKFRWSDYRVYPDTTYKYEVHPVYGTPASPKLEDGPAVEIRTESVRRGEHRVIFNRAAAASQAFSREFPNVDEELAKAKAEGKPQELPPEALAWLSRGILEEITGFIARAADPTWGLDIAIYEYELPAIIDQVKAALDRGADVRIVFHAAPGDSQTKVNEENLAGWPADRMRPRVTSSIFHDKFAVLSRVKSGKRDPVSVLCGSTNWTRSGVYLQANVVHIAEKPEVANTYLTLFELLFGGADVSQTRDWIDTNDPLPADQPLVAGFSPRSGAKDLDAFVAAIDLAKRDVLFCTAFELDDRIDKALLGTPHDDVLRIGLQNKPSVITGYHRDRTADFAATAYLKQGLEGFLEEKTRQPSGILIHTKLVVVNFTSDEPIVISGSHNLSAAASGHNDENYLVIRDDTDVADCYGVEAMRLYDHYRYRWLLDPKNTDPRPDDPCGPRAPNTLCPDNRWTTKYFEAGTLEAADRERFGAPVS
jgi:phosphatidylserine/phosphatidylglycerophosphate/cardiolipin synthase-like enzyme